MTTIAIATHATRCISVSRPIELGSDEHWHHCHEAVNDGRVAFLEVVAMVPFQGLSFFSVPEAPHGGACLPRRSWGRYNQGFRPPIGTSFNGRTPRSGRGYWGSNPYVPATQFALCFQSLPAQGDFTLELLRRISERTPGSPTSLSARIASPSYRESRPTPAINK